MTPACRRPPAGGSLRALLRGLPLLLALATVTSAARSTAARARPALLLLSLACWTAHAAPTAAFAVASAADPTVSAGQGVQGGSGRPAVAADEPDSRPSLRNGGTAGRRDESHAASTAQPASRPSQSSNAQAGAEPDESGRPAVAVREPASVSSPQNGAQTDAEAGEPGAGRPAGAEPDSRPAWWNDAQSRAARDGYRIIDTAGLDAVLALSGAVLLDVRPAYEFAQGHVPGALNLEFDLGDERGISEAKERAVRELLGPDLARPVAVACRGLH